MSQKITAKQIDQLLPQTQCGLCGFKGCMPYAEALANDTAEINLCPPGGVNGLEALGKLLNKDVTTYVHDMSQKAKTPLRAIIREAECIGCTKCIAACPVDAILGSGKVMHTVIADECTGCELCIAPCPVDCITMVTASSITEKKDYFRDRYLARETRLKLSNQKSAQEPRSKSLIDKKAYIQAAILRTKNKIK